MKKQHTIWNSEIDLSGDWLEEMKASYPGKSEDELYVIAYEENSLNLDDERSNLNITVPEGILSIVDAGLWNGRVRGYCEIGKNVANCLCVDADTAHWYVDMRGNLRFEGTHHDGTNYILYRKWKPGISEEVRENFMNALYKGTATEKQISRVTSRLGDLIGDVYGWKFSGNRPA